ncbi:MAG TPA: glutamine--fructose-6-phosphate transaminase (isomerizing) [Rhodothermales bacterium]
MCGIVGYVGERQADDVLLAGLRRLEYRGYDSAGIAVINGDLQCVKRHGKVADLVHLLNGGLEGKIGIGHTRWATHGNPSDANAHPHISSDGRFALVHNGIIENYASLRERLIKVGYTFRSQTDTEVLVHLIHEVAKRTGLDLVESIRQALTQVIGTYGIAVVSADLPDTVIAARKGSPLILGVGEGEYFIASDAAAIIEYTKHVVYLNDGEMVVIRRSGFEVTTIDNVRLNKEVHRLEWDLSLIEKGGYEHFMLKEIMEQPDAIRDCLRGRIRTEDATIKLGGLIDVMDRFKEARRILICACGTSWHAGLVGEYLFEELARIPTEVEYASEFRYRNPIVFEDDIVIAISQSGETADTLAAVREAKSKGALVLGVCNVVGSTIARETDAGVYLHAGPEVGVASTKAYTAQVTVLVMMALAAAKVRGTMSDAEITTILRELEEIPAKIASVLETDAEILKLAKANRLASNFLYMGRGYNFPVALEGALKLKEISYVHAEGYPAAEMKHGPIALIDRLMPVVVIAMKDSTYHKIVSNIQEVCAREGLVVAITDHENHELDEMCEFVLRVPHTEACLTPLLTVVPLQLLAYHMAVLRGCDVDQPRNLAKSVTVE